MIDIAKHLKEIPPEVRSQLCLQQKTQTTDAIPVVNNAPDVVTRTTTHPTGAQAFIGGVFYKRGVHDRIFLWSRVDEEWKTTTYMTPKQFDAAPRIGVGKK